jgi:hypothetical protein
MKKKMKLENLKIQSFVTSLSKEETVTIQGGDNSFNPVCLSGVPACVNTAVPICRNLHSDACPTALADCATVSC